MTGNYLKSLEFEKKYRNRDKDDTVGDEQFRKFKEEEVNTKKMTTILKNLNSPKRKSLQNFYKKRDENSMQISYSDRKNMF
jgi:hypothetical protein